MTTREGEMPQDLDIADDPTGMRALLRSMPDPGPMPADVVLAISNALDETREPIAEVVPINAQAPRRATPRTLHVSRRYGAVAAAAVVCLSWLGLTDQGNGLVGGLLRSASSSSSSDSVSAGAMAQPEAEVRSGGDDLTDVSGGAPDSLFSGSGHVGPAAPGGRELSSVQVYLTDHRYTAANLSGQAAAFVLEAGVRLNPLDSQASPGVPLGTSQAVAACADALKVPKSDVILADLAMFEGELAVVLVTVQRDARTAYVAARDCLNTAPSLLADPVELSMTTKTPEH